MNPLGKKMFKGAAIGGGAGALAGGIYGGIKAKGEINSLPVDTVEVGAYDKPLYETRTVANNMHVNIDFDNPEFSGVSSHRTTAEFPLKNPDGSVKMEHIPARTVTGHGEGRINEVVHDIKEPVGTSTSTYGGTGYSGDGVNVNQYTTVDYRTIGHWTEPVVKFDTGVSMAGNILGFAAAGAAIGGIGGAVVALALDKAGA